MKNILIFLRSLVAFRILSIAFGIFVLFSNYQRGVFEMTQGLAMVYGH